MVGRLLIVCSIAILFYLLMKWSKSKKALDKDIDDDYSNPKPPLYVYYNSSGITIPIQLYFLIAGLMAIFMALSTYRLLDNLLAAITVLFLTAFSAKQAIVVRSMRNAQIIDTDAPGYLTLYGSLIQTIDNPIFALGQSARYAHPSYRKTLEVLHVRLTNGQDPYKEVEYAKGFFRNRILRNFLDDFCENLHQGNLTNDTLQRLIDRADDRKEQAAERKVETYTGIVTIYGGIFVELLLVVIIALVRPQWLDVFVATPFGQMAVLIIIAVIGLMLLIAQRLILLSEV